MIKANDLNRAIRPAGFYVVNNRKWKVIRGHHGRLTVTDAPQPERPVLAEFNNHNDAFEWMQRREFRNDRRGQLGYFFGCVVLMVLVAWLAAYSPMARAAESTINWQAPTQNVDGSPLTDLAGYLVYFGPGPRTYSGNVAIDDPNATTATVQFAADWLQPGDNEIYIAMTAIDGAGNESAYSNEIRRTVAVVDDVAPGTPIIITVTIEIGIDCPAGVTCTVVSP